MSEILLSNTINSKQITTSDLTNLLKNVGIKDGDTLLIHSDITPFGIPKLAKNAYLDAILREIFDTLGSNGTIIFPTYSYSFCNDKIYNPSTTPSKMGALNEHFRKHHAKSRTLDANFSHAISGKNTANLMQADPAHTFGASGFFAALVKLKAKVLSLGDWCCGYTLFHHAEWLANVSYRYEKEFTGTLEINGIKTPHKAIHFVRDYTKSNECDVATYASKNYDKFKKASLDSISLACYDAEQYIKKAPSF